jgi:hypothetical protein
MTFAAAERRYFDLSEPVECDDCEETCTCEQDAEDRAEDAAIDAEQARREAILDDGPGPRWEP